jgi:Lrp/AsnC family transcriptional regulator, leucine-responsive regulatory protein
MNLDNTDWKIIAELQEDARISYAELGRRVGLSSPAAQERVRKLEDMGVIEGYHAKVNPQKLGLPIQAITRLNNMEDYDTIQRVAEMVKTIPEVTRCYQVTGEDEFVIHLQLQSMEHLLEVLHQFSPYARCVTSLVVRTNIDKRFVSLENFPFLLEDES